MKTKLQYLGVSLLFVLGALFSIGMRPVSGQSQFSGGGGGTGGGLPAGLSFSAPTLTVSTAGSGSGVLALSGNTSGTSTITASAVAGTAANPVTFSNVINVNGGSAANVAYGFNGAASSGWYNTGAIFGSVAGTPSVGFNATIFRVPSNSGYSFGSGDASTASDTGISRSAANVMVVGNGTPGNATGLIEAAGHVSAGTKFAQDTGCGSIVTSSGGATAGKFTTVGSTSCTTVITMGNSATAPNGWQCTATDITTSADAANPHMTTSNTTTATIASGTIVSGDVISFSCIGY